MIILNMWGPLELVFFFLSFMLNGYNTIYPFGMVFRMSVILFVIKMVNVLLMKLLTVFYIE